MFRPFLLHKPGVMCCIAGALGQATCGEDVRSSAGVACLRSNIAHNEFGVYLRFLANPQFAMKNGFFGFKAREGKIF